MRGNLTSRMTMDFLGKENFQSTQVDEFWEECCLGFCCSCTQIFQNKPLNSKEMKELGRISFESTRQSLDNSPMLTSKDTCLHYAWTTIWLGPQEKLEGVKCKSCQPPNQTLPPSEPKGVLFALLIQCENSWPANRTWSCCCSTLIKRLIKRLWGLGRSYLLAVFCGRLRTTYGHKTLGIGGGEKSCGQQCNESIAVMLVFLGRK